MTLVPLTQGILDCAVGVHAPQARQHAGRRSASELTHALASMRVSEGDWAVSEVARLDEQSDAADAMLSVE